MTLDPCAQSDLGFCSRGWVGAPPLPARGGRTPGSQLHTSVRIRPKARPRLGTRSPGKPPTPVRQHRPGPEVEGRLLAGSRCLFASPGTAWHPLNTAVTVTPGTGKPRATPLTFDHLHHQRGPCALPAHDSKASGRRGGGEDRVAREQPAAESGGAATTPPKFKKTESLKGRAQGQGTATPLGHPPQGRRGPANPGSSKLLKRPQTKQRGSGTQTSPSRSGWASARYSAAPGQAPQQFCTWSRGLQQSVGEGMPASENKQLQKPLKGLVRRDRLGGDLPSDERALLQPRTQLLSPPPLGGRSGQSG